MSEQGITTDPEKIRAVREWPKPKNVHELRAFLGNASDYRRYCQGFCDITEILSAYVFEIQHRAGRLHGNSDGLSRISCGQETKSEEANKSCDCNSAGKNQGESSSLLTTSSQQAPVGKRERENLETYLRVTTRAEAGSSASWE